MFKLVCNVPKTVAVAVSGGIDSMAALDFLARKKNVTVLHYNHGTDFADRAQEVVEEYCKERQLPCLIGTLKSNCPKGRSKEDFWREKRYQFFESFSPNSSVVTCHHLDDVVETWLFTSLHGRSRLIPTQRGRFIRPFLACRKNAFNNWVHAKDVPFVQDPSNENVAFMRNYIRHVMMPNALHVNPGLHKVLKKKILSSNE